MVATDAYGQGAGGWDRRELWRSSFAQDMARPRSGLVAFPRANSGTAHCAVESLSIYARKGIPETGEPSTEQKANVRVF